jgi:hypothetical protein
VSIYFDHVKDELVECSVKLKRLKMHKYEGTRGKKRGLGPPRENQGHQEKTTRPQERTQKREHGVH